MSWLPLAASTPLFDFPAPERTVLRWPLQLKRGGVTGLRRLFAVMRSRGPVWDAGKPLEGQSEWPAHVDFMNALAAEGFVVVGGPLEETEDVLLIVCAEHEDEIRRRLAGDPWSRGMLKLVRIAPWSLKLGEGRLAGGECD